MHAALLPSFLTHISALSRQAYSQALLSCPTHITNSMSTNKQKRFPEHMTHFLKHQTVYNPLLRRLPDTSASA